MVERTTRLVILVKVDGTTATDTGFSDKLTRSLRLLMTDDQYKEIMKHVEITQKTSAAVYFAAQHSPWQRGSNRWPAPQHRC